METHRILALDVGHKRIGVALSDPLNIIAQGLTTLLRNAPEQDLEAIRQLVEQHEVKAIVVAALMKHAVRRCDEDETKAYLESTNPRNISLYERHGFEVVGEVQAGSVPLFTAMIRLPR